MSITDLIAMLHEAGIKAGETIASADDARLQLMDALGSIDDAKQAVGMALGDADSDTLRTAYAMFETVHGRLISSTFALESAKNEAAIGQEKCQEFIRAISI